MPPTARLPLSESALNELLSLARLELTPERRAAAGPAFELILGLMDSLDDVELGETPPATAFDPSWE